MMTAGFAGADGCEAWYYVLVPTKAPIKSKPAILQVEPLKKFPWLVHAFSTRHAGNLGFTRDAARRTVERDREVFIQRLTRTKPWPLVTLRQIHSDIIHHVNEAPDQPLAGDGLVTRTARLLIAIQTADCLPVIVVDPRNRAIGVFHAGWRGTVKRIVEKGVGEMRRYFGTQAKDTYAAIGPGVHDCCYQVGPEVRERFESQFPYAADLFRETKESDEIHERYPLLFLTARAPGHSEGQLPKKIFLDLVEANRRQLLDAGVPAKRITASPLCTSCRGDLLFSYRKEKESAGRLMGVAGIRKPGSRL